MRFVLSNACVYEESKYHPSKTLPSFVGLLGKVIVSPSFRTRGLTSLPPCVSNVIVNSFFGASGVSVLLQATSAHDKTSAIVRMARTTMILFLLDFITNLAKTYCRASKKAKNITSFPRRFCHKPHILKQKTMSVKNTTMEIVRSFLKAVFSTFYDTTRLCVLSIVCIIYTIIQVAWTIVPYNKNSTSNDAR